MKKFNPSVTLATLDTENYLHIPNNGFYKYQDGGFWEETNSLYIEAKIKEAIGEPSKYEISEVLKLFQLITLIPEGKELNFERYSLNVQNGILDIKTGELLPHKKEIYSTIQLPVNFNPDSVCPRWTQFLMEVLQDENLILIVQEFIGLCLIPETKFEKCLVLYGTGSNGKSTILKIISFLFGRRNISTISMAKLDSDFHRAHLFNKLVNISSELEVKKEIESSGYFKSIISGDIIDAAYKFKDIFSFKPFCRLIFAMNDLPKINDRSFGFFRRLLIIPFNKCFTGTNADKDLETKLLSELDGIFIWALEGLNRLFEQDKFTPSKIADDMVAQYQKESNPVLTFLEERCSMSGEEHISKDEFYKLYNNFCKENGYYPLNNANFYKEVRKNIPNVKEEHRRLENGKRERIIWGVHADYQLN